MEMIATDGDSYVYSDSGILLQSTASVSIFCLLLSCCRPPFGSWFCTMPVKGSWQVCCTTELAHSLQCPNVALGVTVTVTVTMTVNRGTIKDQKALRDASACKGLQDTA